jgi:hypothetical protein
MYEECKERSDRIFDQIKRLAQSFLKDGERK